MKKSKNTSEANALYQQAARQFGRDLARFVAGYERDEARRQDLLQEVHLALWRSCSGFAGQCSLRTWVYRVAHNVGVSHVQRSMRRVKLSDSSVEALELRVDEGADMQLTERRIDLQRVMALVHALIPLDRTLMLLYLEDLDAASIADITGLSARNVATKIHRIKQLLINRLGQQESSCTSKN